MTLTIARAESPEDLDAVRDLIRAFFAWAMAQVQQKGEPGTPSVFDGLEAELAGLPGRFGPPSGCLVLARLDGMPVGCVGFRELSPGTMEIKRMFVRPEVWGKGVGGAMLDMALTEAHAAGHTRYILSTHRELRSAQALYARKGFQVVDPTDEFPGVKPEIEVCMAMTPGIAPGAAQ